MPAVPAGDAIGIDMAGLAIGDGLLDITSYALNGLSRRSEVRANNVANAATPEFLASTVDFETALRSKIDDRDFDAMADRDHAVMLADGFIDERGNSVDLEKESTDLVQDNLLFQAVINGFNYKVGVLRTAMGNA
ncbi:MAG: hypothetical protein GY708_10750 [Actinomycetia bacterium]|nr:hypothetical protein [Actinomycetes bacterium]MCP4960836.1 hypothetical protein [Actinomycetes bacterium]